MLKTQKRKTFSGVYMLLIAMLGQLLYYIQAWKIFYTKSAGDISLTAYAISLIALIHWVTYGFMIQDQIVIKSGSVGIIGAMIVVLGIMLYS